MRGPTLEPPDAKELPWPISTPSRTRRHSTRSRTSANRKWSTPASIRRWTPSPTTATIPTAAPAGSRVRRPSSPGATQGSGGPSRSPSPARARVVEEAGREVVRVPGDVRDEAHCQNVVQKAADEFGRIDVLINNAAYQMVQPGGIADITTEQFDRVL